MNHQFSYNNVTKQPLHFAKTENEAALFVNPAQPESPHCAAP